jgi:hypothetical protein
MPQPGSPGFPRRGVGPPLQGGCAGGSLTRLPAPFTGLLGVRLEPLALAEAQHREAPRRGLKRGIGFPHALPALQGRAYTPPGKAPCRGLKHRQSRAEHYCRVPGRGEQTDESPTHVVKKSPAADYPRRRPSPEVAEQRDNIILLTYAHLSILRRVCLSRLIPGTNGKEALARRVIMQAVRKGGDPIPSLLAAHRRP